MIQTAEQDVMKAWLYERLQWVPSPYARTIGSVAPDGTLRGVVGYDHWNGASLEMVIAGEAGWLNKTFLRVAFDYPFNVLNCNVVMVSVASSNPRSLGIATRLGFKIECTIPKAHKTGDLHILSLRKEDCTWLERKDNG